MAAKELHVVKWKGILKKCNEIQCEMIWHKSSKMVNSSKYDFGSNTKLQ
jgi:hypothetical protein